MITGNYKVDRLLEAMARHEGWDPLAVNGTQHGSASYRRHNPGNLRVSPFEAGTEGNFAVFPSDFIGWFAFYFDIFQKAQGKTSTGLNGDSTIAQLINVWAPPSDNNDTEAYIAAIEAESGLKRTQTLKEVFGLK